MNLSSKYTYDKNYIEKVFISNNINEKSNRGSYHYQKIKGVQNINGKKKFRSLQNTASKTNDKFEFKSHYPNVFSSDNSKACVVLDEINENFDIYQPPPKKCKILKTSGDINTKINEDWVKTSNKSEQTILLSKSKHRKVGIQLENPKKEKNSTDNFLDVNIHGFVGVEYVVKILSESNRGQPKYECGLCEVVMDGSGMQNHLTDYKHRLKFCEKHFPTALQKYRQYVLNVPLNKNDNVMAKILNKLAIAIEQHHGRDLPYECLESEFNINRHEILSKVYSCRHASEQYGPTFSHIIDSKEVDKLTEEINMYNPTINIQKEFAFDQPNSTLLHIRPHTRQKRPFHSSMHRCLDEDISGDKNLDNNKILFEDILKNNCKNTHSSSNVIYKHFSQAPSPSRSISTVPKLSSHRESFSPLHENTIWQTYRHIVDQKIMDLNEAYQIYRADPERHPSYDREWQMFWKRCKNEVIKAGLDYRTYNYQPEWVRFFKIRIEELYNNAADNIKIDARESLYLSIKNESLIDEKYFVHDKVVATDNSPIRKYSKKKIHYKKSQIISVLHSLTYLEEYLGSLGPKIIEILTKALQAEKSFTSDFYTIILSTEDYSILETTMEKFRGIVVAGVLEDPKHLTILRKAIDEIEFLLFDSIKLKSSRLNIDNWVTKGEICPKMNENIPNENLLLNDNCAQVDKKEFAFKLARLLSAQGKTDIDPVHLQTIITVYMLIEKKKQIKSKQNGTT